MKPLYRLRGLPAAAGWRGWISSVTGPSGWARWHAGAGLRLLRAALILGCETVGPAHSVRSALTLIDGAALDGAILDLSLANNERSYAVAALLRDRGIPFAFATGYEARDVDPRFRFKDTMVLSKPFEFEAVKAAIGKLLPGTMAQSR
jgi:hypothetical protein